MTEHVYIMCIKYMKCTYTIFIGSASVFELATMPCELVTFLVFFLRQEGNAVKFDIINLNSSVQWFTAEDYSSM